MTRISIFFSFFFLAYLNIGLADLISPQTPVQDVTDLKPRMPLKRRIYPKPYRPYVLRLRKPYPGYSYIGGRFYPAYNNYNASSSYPVQEDSNNENYDDSATTTNYDNSNNENYDSTSNSNSNYGGNYNYNPRQGNNYYSRQGYNPNPNNYNNNNYNSNYGQNRKNYNNNNYKNNNNYNNNNNNNYNNQQNQYTDNSEYPENSNSYDSDTTGYDAEIIYENTGNEYNYNQDPAYSEDESYAAQDDGYSSDSYDYTITVPNGEVRTFGDKQYGYDNDPATKLAEIERLASDLKYQGYYSSNSNYKRDAYDDYVTTWKYAAGEYCNLRVIFLHFYKQTQSPSTVYGTTTYNTADINGAYYGSTENYPDCNKQYLLLDDGTKTVQYCGHEAIPPGFRTLSSYITIKHYSAYGYNKRWEFLGLISCT